MPPRFKPASSISRDLFPDMPTILPPLRKLESLELRCPLAVRFRDTTTGQLIGWGLRVSAYPIDALWPEALRRFAHPNRSGTWIFHHLAELREYETGSDAVPETGSPPHRPQFRIEVQDIEGRFLPFSFTAEVPVTGLFQLAPMSFPLWPGTEVPLFSAPERALPPACAVIRTSLVTVPEELPAAWALVEATTTVRSRSVQLLGISDPRGSVALIFPWPELVGLTFSSPPATQHLDSQGWEFELAAWHDFNAEVGTLADLDAILARLNRPPDRLGTELSPPGEVSQAFLTFGRELVIPDLDFTPDHKRQLLIMPAE
jgi:hypothetical protein